MIVGIDVSTANLAFCGIANNGDITTRVIPLDPSLRGGWRFSEAHRLAHIGLAQFSAVVAVGVEIPWAVRPSFDLLGVAAVASMAAQERLPSAVVMEMTTGSWKKESVGFGNASKADVMAHAQSRGLLLDDQDLADALCIAECMVGRWDTRTEAAA